MTAALQIRIGLPIPGGQLARAAAALDAPVLISANAFRRDGVWRRVSDSLAGLDIALDSAGFVAMKRYGGFPWSAAEYLDLVAAHRWAWYAAMDYCCEPEIAGDRATVLERVTRTAADYPVLARMAADRELPPPLPVFSSQLRSTNAGRIPRSRPPSS